MKHTLALSSLLFLFVQPSFAQTENNYPTCGGQIIDSKETRSLDFKRNPLNGVYSADDREERVLIFIDLSREGKIHLSLAETLTQKEWATAQALIASLSDFPDSKSLIKRLAKARTQELWLNWNTDNYFHIETAQGDVRYSFSCQKK